MLGSSDRFNSVMCIGNSSLVFAGFRCGYLWRRSRSRSLTWEMILTLSGQLATPRSGCTHNILLALTSNCESPLLTVKQKRTTRTSRVYKQFKALIYSIDCAFKTRFPRGFHASVNNAVAASSLSWIIPLHLIAFVKFLSSKLSTSPG
jgi:hypothetical protein